MFDWRWPKKGKNQYVRWHARRTRNKNGNHRFGHRVLLRYEDKIIPEPSSFPTDFEPRDSPEEVEQWEQRCFWRTVSATKWTEIAVRTEDVPRKCRLQHESIQFLGCRTNKSVKAWAKISQNHGKNLFLQHEIPYSQLHPLNVASIYDPQLPSVIGFACPCQNAQIWASSTASNIGVLWPCAFWYSAFCLMGSGTHKVLPLYPGSVGRKPWQSSGLLTEFLLSPLLHPQSFPCFPQFHSPQSQKTGAWTSRRFSGFIQSGQLYCCPLSKWWKHSARNAGSAPGAPATLARCSVALRSVGWVCRLWGHRGHWRHWSHRRHWLWRLAGDRRGWCFSASLAPFHSICQVWDQVFGCPQRWILWTLSNDDLSICHSNPSSCLHRIYARNNSRTQSKLNKL